MPLEATFWPVGLRLRGRRVVIVGGGLEAGLKVLRLHPYGADLTLVAAHWPENLPLDPWRTRVRWIARPYRPGDLTGQHVVLVAEEDSAAGRLAAEDARAAGLLLNVADVLEASDFIAMAGVRRGPVEIAVHTSGHSAALSRRLRERLDADVSEQYGPLARVLGAARGAVRRTIPTAAARRTFWLSLVDETFLRRMEEEPFEADGLQREIEGRLRAYVANRDGEESVR